MHQMWRGQEYDEQPAEHHAEMVRKEREAKMNHYLVISPEFAEMIPIMDDGSGPLEYGCCVVSVEARTKREAKIAAIKHSDMQQWVQEQRDDNCNPFAGLTVKNPVCPHGICSCNLCKGECKKCEEEWER